jgi:diguanylate cyclase (GGDEF)-like protein
MRAERENDHRARHDPMTGLLNRAGLEREIDLMHSEHPDANLTLFFVDLDGFKLINDTFGHGKGDRMLRLVADRLLALSGSSDIVARIGGDEFVIITALQYVDAIEFGAAILSAVKGAGVLLDTDDARIGASVGVAQTRDHGSDLSTMLLAADMALYGAKRMGGSKCVIAPPTEGRVPGRP